MTNTPRKGLTVRRETGSARGEGIGPKACASAEASQTRRADLRRTPDSLAPPPHNAADRPRDAEGVPSAGAGSVAASDDLGESTKRLVAELGDARQSIIDLQGANAAYVRANGKLRDELLAREQFDTLLEAKVLIERWRRHFNAVRPHSSLGYRAPAPEAIQPRSPASATPQQANEAGVETSSTLTY